MLERLSISSFRFFLAGKGLSFRTTGKYLGESMLVGIVVGLAAAAFRWMINWGRVLPQIVYYVSAYCELVAGGAIRAGTPVNICVPTGNFGNILAAWYARQMGVPVKTLLCASNENDVLTEFIRTGVYNRNRPFYQTA